MSFTVAKQNLAYGSREDQRQKRILSTRDWTAHQDRHSLPSDQRSPAVSRATDRLFPYRYSEYR